MNGSPLIWPTTTEPSALQLFATEPVLSPDISTMVALDQAIGTFSVYTGLNGAAPNLWLPDGTYSTSFTMSPGAPAARAVTLGPTSSSCFVAEAGYVEFPVHLTRIFLCAVNSNGTTYIAKTGTWSISPVGLSAAVNGQATSQSWWLPNGNYTGTLSGSGENGSSAFSVHLATDPMRKNVIVTTSGPIKTK